MPPDPGTLHNLLRATAREPWESWYAQTRLVLADYLEERGLPGDPLAAGLVREARPVARWELALGPDEALSDLRMQLGFDGEADVFLEARRWGETAFSPVKTFTVRIDSCHEHGFADFFRTYRPPAVALALSCILWPRETLSVSLSVLHGSDWPFNPWSLIECPHTLTGADAARACRRRVLALFPEERVPVPCPACRGHGATEEPETWMGQGVLVSCLACHRSGVQLTAAPDLLPEKEPA